MSANRLAELRAHVEAFGGDLLSECLAEIDALAAEISFLHAQGPQHIKPLAARFAEKYIIDAATGCWNWAGRTDKSGYGWLAINGRQRPATHTSLLLAGRPLRKGLCALHHCDNPSCVNPKHLFIGTHADNVRDKMAKGRGRTPHGEENGQAKLTLSKVEEIRRLSSKGVPSRKIARLFGVGKSTINRAISRENWRDHAEA